MFYLKDACEIIDIGALNSAVENSLYNWQFKQDIEMFIVKLYI